MVDDTSKSSAALYNAIQGATNEGILVIDLRGQVISYNDQFLEIWDIPKNFAEHADDSKLLSYVQDKLLNWDQFLDLVNHLYDHPEEERTNDLIALKSGKILSRNTKPVRTVDGEIIARAWNFADVSKIATASAELEGSEKRYRTLFESAPVGMVVIRQKIILFANQKFTNMVGYNDPQTIIGLEIGQFQPDEFREFYTTRDLRREQGHDEPGSYDAFFIDVDQKKFPVHIDVVRIGFPDGPALLAFIQDKTTIVKAEREREKLQKQIQHSQKLESLGLLAGGIAHDFNNILVGIMGNVNVLLSKVDPDSSFRDYLTKIEESSKRAGNLVNQMLAYAGKSHINKTVHRMADLLEEMKNLIAISTPENVTIEYHLDEKKDQIEVDTTQIQQIILNLVTNAIESMDETSGRIVISTGCIPSIGKVDLEIIDQNLLKIEKFCYLEVKDFGKGIDPDIQQKIFDPFFSTKFTGRGLGLAVVSGIVKSHNGVIDIASVPNEGTTFRIFFPTTTKSISTNVDHKERVPNTILSRGILIVDDDKVVRDVLVAMIKSLKMTVFESENGPKALAILDENYENIELAILDLTMPNMGGLELYSKIRTKFKVLPIILSSGFSHESIPDELFKDTRLGFLQKPFTLESLTQQITKVSNQDPTRSTI